MFVFVLEFTYRSARSGSLLAGIGIALLVETVVLHLWLVAPTPNVLITLAGPAQLRLPGGLRRRVRRIGLHVDEPWGLVSALTSRAEAMSPGTMNRVVTPGHA